MPENLPLVSQTIIAGSHLVCQLKQTKKIILGQKVSYSKSNNSRRVPGYCD